MIVSDQALPWLGRTPQSAAIPHRLAAETAFIPVNSVRIAALISAEIKEQAELLGRGHRTLGGQGRVSRSG